MNSKRSLLQRNVEGLFLPECVSTRSGQIFDPRAQRWVFRDGVKEVSMPFSDLGLEEVPWFDGFKLALVWQLKNASPSHAVNVHVRSRHFFRYLVRQYGALPQVIAAEHLISYSADPVVIKRGYLSGLGGFLQQWHSLGYPGVSESVVDFYKSVRLKGNEKGVAIRTMDPHKGPLTVMETAALLDALSSALRDKKVSAADYLLAWLVVALGMRPIQYAALKVCDFKVIRPKNGEETFVLAIPRAKQRWIVDMRSLSRERAILPEVGRLLLLHVQAVKQSYFGLISDVEMAPMFPTKRKQRQSLGYEFHNSSAALGQLIRATLGSLDVRSHRTGELLNVSAVRFRRTVGTRAAEEGHGPLVIAELLDHSDTQSVGVYVEATPEIIERLDRAIAIHMAPLAQAFAGKLIKGESEATRGADPSSRIIDLRVDRSGQAMGSCGQYSHCGFSAPIACYRCSCFEPWLDGPHERVLEYLLDRREKLLETTDHCIASVNDLAIIAVAEVVKRCADAKKNEPGRESSV